VIDATNILEDRSCVKHLDVQE